MSQQKKLRITKITSIQDIVDLTMSGFADWKQYGNVNCSQKDDLLLFCYNQDAVFSRQWNFFEVASRGLIINKVTGEIVARGFDKFFNWFEDGRKSNGRIMTITEKVDGSLVILYRHDNQYKLATKGSFSSEQAQWATAFLNDNYDLIGLPNELTLLFEAIYPENRLVVNYGNRQDLVLLAARNRFTGDYLPFYPDTYQLAMDYGFSLPKVYDFNNVTQILELLGKLEGNEEGYVVEFSDGQRFKFKGDKYLELHKLINGLSFKNTLKAYQSGQVAYIKSQLPDEFLDDFNSWIQTIEDTISNIKQKTQTLFDIAPKDNQKEFALWCTENHKDMAVYLFAMKSGHDLLPYIYKHAFKDL